MVYIPFIVSQHNQYIQTFYPKNIIYSTLNLDVLYQKIKYSAYYKNTYIFL